MVVESSENCEARKITETAICKHYIWKFLEILEISRYYYKLIALNF